MQNLISMAFSIGPRGCLGKQLAMLESKIAVIKFMMRYKQIEKIKERAISFMFLEQFDCNLGKFVKA